MALSRSNGLCQRHISYILSTADLALLVFLKRCCRIFHCFSVDVEHLSRQKLTKACEELDRLHDLQGSDQGRGTSENRKGFLPLDIPREDARKTGGLTRDDGGYLTYHAVDAAMDKRHTRLDAALVQDKPRLHVIQTIYNKVDPPQ